MEQTIVDENELKKYLKEKAFLADKEMFNSIVDRKHKNFTMEIKNGSLIFFLDDKMSSYLYDIDVTDDYEKSLSCIYFVTPDYETDRVMQLLEQIVNDFDIDKYDGSTKEQVAIMTLIAHEFYNSQFGSIKDLNNLPFAIPIQLFVEKSSEFYKNKKMYIKNGDYEYCGLFDSLSIQSSWGNKYISLRLSIISKSVEKYVVGSQRFALPFIKTISKLSDLGFELADKDTLDKMAARGKKYVQYTREPSYCNYNGFGYESAFFGDDRSSVASRVMIDLQSFRYMNSDIGDGWYKGNPLGGSAISDDYLKDNIDLCSPVVYGFSFNDKSWFRMNLDGISNINFADHAFDKLIIPEDYKDLLLSSVVNDMPSLDDIQGKGNGKIYLLYGPAGVGKTATAESISEYLRKPLYYVTVGELGINPQEMEYKLSQLMSVAERWNAIVLLDEVDVFAVKRTGSDIQRNAMTAILLRLLERFNGIMFMTTNLLDNLDPAFKSRATICIPYEELSNATKVTIWTSMFDKIKQLNFSSEVMVNVDEEIYDYIDVHACEFKLNGREIKNIARLCYSLALSKDNLITVDILRKVLSINKIQSAPIEEYLTK